MRKLVLLAAIVLAATFSTKSDVFAAGGEMANPNQNTIDFMRDAMTGGPVVQPAAPGAKKRAHKKKK